MIPHGALKCQLLTMITSTESSTRDSCKTSMPVMPMSTFPSPTYLYQEWKCKIK